MFALCAARAAFASLARWSVGGISGENTSVEAGGGTFSGRAFVSEFTTELADTLGAATWRASDSAFFEPAAKARRAVWSVGCFKSAIGTSARVCNLGSGCGSNERALEQRLEEEGETWEWAEILRGLDNLQENFFVAG
jgi:hypothetical protein